MIELKNITKIFRQKGRAIAALSDLTLYVPAGRILGVIGASGAGKSTLIRCVNLLEQPTSGTVFVDGQNLMALSGKQLTKARKQIGMIFQHFNLLSSRTVSGNIALPLELDRVPQSEIKRRVAELLALVGLEDKQNDYPANLSGGQKQRVAIARALSSNPKVLLCDEATSALDPATTRSILDLLKDINRRLHITILLITHEMDVVKAICDEVAVISEGRLIEQGPVSAIFSHPQTELAKEFIASTIKVALPNDYKLRLSSENGADKRPILRLEFTGESIDDAALSNVSRQFRIDHHIVCGQMDFAAGVKFGVIITEMAGTPENVSQALAYFRSKLIKAEVLGYV